MSLNLLDEITRLNDAYFKVLGIPVRDQNSAALHQHETAQHILDRTPQDLPDFSQEEDLRECGVLREYRKELADVMSHFQMQNQCVHENLMKSLAKLERALLSAWQA